MNNDVNKRHQKDVFVLFCLMFFMCLIGIIMQYILYKGFRFTAEGVVILIDGQSKIYDLYQLPLGIIIQTMKLSIIIYTGAEGSISVITSLKMPVNNFKRMPSYKYNRMRWFVFFWVVLIIISSIFQIQYVDERDVNFFVSEFYEGFGITVTLYIGSYVGPKITKDLHVEKKEKKKTKERVDITIDEEISGK